MQVDKELAIKLRLQGKTYAKIAEEIGCSVIWCKMNLKGLKRKDISEGNFKELVAKGRSPDCVTHSEIFSKLNDIEVGSLTSKSKEKVKMQRRVKDKLKAEDDVIVRNAWIHPERAKYSLDTMLMYINDLNETLDEYVRSYLYDCGFDNLDNYNSALSFMIHNSQYGQRIDKRYVAGVLEAVRNTVENIDERNGEIPIVIEEKSIDYLGITEDELPY